MLAQSTNDQKAYEYNMYSFYEMRSCYVVKGGLELLRVQAILLSQPPKPRLEDDQTG